MIYGAGKTAGILAVSATLGFSGLSAKAEAHIQPISQCERDVRTWCYANWQEYFIALGYEGCVSSETLRRCSED
jgi:hypothetical protein